MGSGIGAIPIINCIDGESVDQIGPETTFAWYTLESRFQKKDRPGAGTPLDLTL